MVNPPAPGTGSSFQEGFLGRPMGVTGILLFGFFFVLLAVGVVQLLIAAWPDQTGGVMLFGIISIQIPDGVDLRLILIAILSGVLGAFIHAATSFADYLGNRKLKRSWAAWYLLRPFIGMALALLFYFLIRGGFLAPGAAGGAISPYGIAAIGGLAGMFSKNASDKLEQVFKDIFKPPTETEAARGDKLTG